jgi:3',5'-cyclic-AMP phosphodiesterase
VLKVAWATDIHLNFVTAADADAWCRSVERLRAGAVLISGDIAEAPSLVGWLRFLQERITAPIYFVTGNHDYYHGSFLQVRQQLEDLTRTSPRLHWLDAVGLLRLTEQTGLIGHGGWADGRNGDYAGSSLQLNDHRLIADFLGLDTWARARLLAKLGDEAAAHVHHVLPPALDRFEHIIFLTHVPPFPEASWHEGQLADAEALPHFTCKAVGDALLHLMRDRPDRLLTVLCGHTHSAGEAWLLPNLQVKTGGAVYGQPAVQPPMYVR